MMLACWLGVDVSFDAVTGEAFNSNSNSHPAMLHFSGAAAEVFHPVEAGLWYAQIAPGQSKGSLLPKMTPQEVDAYNFTVGPVPGVRDGKGAPCYASLATEPAALDVYQRFFRSFFILPELLSDLQLKCLFPPLGAAPRPRMRPQLKAATFRRLQRCRSR